MGVRPRRTRVRASLPALLLAALVLASCGGEDGAPGDRTAPGELPVAGAERACVERAEEPADGTYSVLARATPVRSVEAPTPSRARFTGDGRVLVVDRTRPRVFEAPRSLDDFRPVGRAGPGPGEYASPVDAVRSPGGGIVVLDGDPPSLVVYSEDGGFRREVRLWPGARALAADDTALYVSTFLVPPRYDGSEAGPPVLGRIRLDGPEVRVDTLLRYRSGWRGGPPVWNLPAATTYPRAGADGKLYLAWTAAHEVWRVEGDTVSVAVRGCIPEELVEGYRDASGDPRPVGRLVEGLAVRPGGQIVVRGGHAGPDRAVDRQLFGADGSLARSWALGREDSIFTRATLHPDSSGLELSWSRSTGELRLLRFREEGTR